MRRIGKHDHMAILHVHYKDKWKHPRQRTTISQMNIRHTVPAKGTLRPANAYWDKCIDLDKWREMRGKMVFKIPPAGWKWRHDPKFSPAMHRLLLEAEKCTQKVRSLQITPSAGAAAGSQTGARRALIVAVEKYDSPALAGLANVDNDAVQLKKTLQLLGWHVEVARDGGRAEVMEAIRGFAQDVAGSGDACLLAFIGHGLEVAGHVFLVPRDAKVGEGGVGAGDWAQFVRLAEVQAVFAEHRGNSPGDAEAMMFLMDCCRIGLEITEEGLRAVMALGSTRIKVVNSITTFSAFSGEPAGDGQSGAGGPFMNIFTEELKQSAGQGITDVTRRTRKRLMDSSPHCQLAQDEDALTAPLVLNLGLHAARSGGHPVQETPARKAAACTFRVTGEVLASAQVREGAMAMLWQWAQNQADDAPRRMLVHGLGGAGKTTLARMFAARAAKEGLREAVLFLAVSAGDYMEEYLELAKVLGGSGGAPAAQKLQSLSAEALRKYVHGLLRSAEWEGKWLMVLDDLPDPEDADAEWVAREFPFGSGTTLVTSRSPEWAEEGGAGLWAALTLQGMTEEEASALVLRRVPAWAEEQEGVLELVRRLGCLPLAVEQAAAFSKQYSIETPALYMAEQVKERARQSFSLACPELSLFLFLCLWYICRGTFSHDACGCRMGRPRAARCCATNGRSGGCMGGSTSFRLRRYGMCNSSWLLSLFRGLTRRKHGLRALQRAGSDCCHAQVISLTFERLLMADDDGSVRSLAAVIFCRSAIG